MTIRSAVADIPDEVGIGYLKRYYALLEPHHAEAKKPAYAGAHFEALDFDIGESNRVTGSDLYALSTLQINVPRDAGIGILAKERQKITDLLIQIPHAKLENFSATDFQEHLGPDSPAMQLWDLLRRNNPGDKKWGVGPTTASKIMARKRPHLFPINDSIINRVVGHTKKDNEWQLWWKALTTDDDLMGRAKMLREAAIDSEEKRPELSTLRALDVMLWMSGKQGIHKE